MRVIVRDRTTLDGHTYLPGEYVLEDRLAQKLLHTFRRRVQQAEPAVLKKAEETEESVCGFMTASGVPCQRRVVSPGERCYQHKGG